jgi:hypothetical protein
MDAVAGLGRGVLFFRAARRALAFRPATAYQHPDLSGR